VKYLDLIGSQCSASGIGGGRAAKLRALGELADAEIAALEAENERLRGLVNDLEAKGIHTCHDECQRVECVLRRERDALRHGT